MNDVMQISVCVFAALLVIMVAIRVVVGTLKFLYAWAPVLVFLGAILSVLYLSGSLDAEIAAITVEVQNANNIGSVETKSGRSEGGDKRDNLKVLHPTTSGSKGIEDRKLRH
jgi:hypothetical protein